MPLTTRSSLLARLGEGGDVPWREFDGLYTPFLLRVAARCGLAGQDVDEAVQMVMVDLHRASMGTALLVLETVLLPAR
jgi:hypothetical protein